jgi:hypothetical protein
MNSSAKMPCESLSEDEQNLSRIIALASAVGLGAMLALSQAVRVQDGAFSLHFSVKTAIAFAVGFGATFVYLSRILVCLERTSRLFVRGGLIVLMILVLGAFIYPLRFPIDQLGQRLWGVATALGFIAVGLTLIRFVVRGAEREEAEQEAKEHKPSNTPSPQT